MLRKTTSVVKELGLSYARMRSLLRAEKLKAPAKDESGDYVWSQEDIEALRKAMAIDFRYKQQASDKN